MGHAPAEQLTLQATLLHLSRNGPCLFRIQENPVHVHGFVDVLDGVGPHVLEAQLDLAPDLAEGAAGNEDAAAVRQRLDAGCHVHAFAVDVAVLRHDDVSDVDPDPELDLPLCGHFLLEVGHRPLDLGRALHGVHGAGEFRQQPVAGPFDDAPVVIRDRGIDQVRAVGLLARQGPGLVAFHEARVPDHVECEYGGEPAFHPLPSGGCRVDDLRSERWPRKALESMRSRRLSRLGTTTRRPSPHTSSGRGGRPSFPGAPGD